MNLRFYKSIGLVISAILMVAAPVRPQEPEGKLRFSATQRVIAHGDEFNEVALTSDNKRLLIASERGEVIVWNIADKRIEKRLNQGQPVHFVAGLGDPRYLVAAGSEHHAQGKSAVIRKWNLETGEFTEWHGLDCDYFITGLAVDRARDLVAAVAAKGCITVWNASTNTVSASWQINRTPLAVAVLDDSVYVSSVDREEFRANLLNGTISTYKIGAPNNSPAEVTKQAGQVVSHFYPSPDKLRMSVSVMVSPYASKTALLDLKGMKLGEPFAGDGQTWLSNSSLLLFDWLDPGRIVAFDRSAKQQVIETFEHAMLKLEGNSGRAFGLRGQVASPDGKLAWSVYDHGAELIEWDLKSHSGRKLLTEQGGAYALSVRASDKTNGLVLSGGSDGYVRLWSLPELTKRREFKIGDETVVMDAQLFPDGKRALVASYPYPKQYDDGRMVTEPSSQIILNLETGEKKKVFGDQKPQVHTRLIGNNILHGAADRLILSTHDESVIREYIVGKPFQRYSISPDERWLTVLTEGELYLFEIASGTITARTKTSLEPICPVAVGNDGHFVYSVSRDEVLTRWDTRTGELKQTPLTFLSERHDRTDFITLSSDGQQLLVCGSHSDMAIINPDTAELHFYAQFSAGVWFVESAWLAGESLVFTLDTGVLYSGKLVRKE